MSAPHSASERLDDLGAALKGLAEICLQSHFQFVEGVHLHALMRILGEECNRIGDEFEEETKAAIQDG